MPRGKKATPSKTPSASFLGDDPVFDEDEDAGAVVEEKPEPIPAPAPVYVAPPPPPPAPKITWDAPAPPVDEKDHPLMNKPLVLFSHAQFAALTAYLAESRTTLSDEKRRAFDSGHMGQIMKNLRG